MTGYVRQWGLVDMPLLLQQVTPALDLIKTCPPDPAHLEFKGLTNLMHEMLLDVSLKPLSKTLYTRIL